MFIKGKKIQIFATNITREIVYRNDNDVYGDEVLSIRQKNGPDLTLPQDAKITITIK